MNLPVIATVTREPYAQAYDARNALADMWGAPVLVDAHGWWLPPVTSAPSQNGHRGALVALQMLVPAGTVCGDKDRWTVAGGTYYQVGSPEDYNNGPWSVSVPLILHLSNVKW